MAYIDLLRTHSSELSVAEWEMLGETREALTKWTEEIRKPYWQIVRVSPCSCQGTWIQTGSSFSQGNTGGPRAFHFDISTISRTELTDSEVREIGEFTRENVASWMKRQILCFDSMEGDISAFLGVWDFHAVSGDSETPWASEEGKLYIPGKVQIVFDDSELVRETRRTHQGFWEPSAPTLSEAIGPPSVVTLPLPPTKSRTRTGRSPERRSGIWKKSLC